MPGHPTTVCELDQDIANYGHAVSVCGRTATASTVVSDWPRTHGRADVETLRTVLRYETGGRPTLTIRHHVRSLAMDNQGPSVMDALDTTEHTVAQSSRSLSAALTY